MDTEADSLRAPAASGDAHAATASRGAFGDLRDANIPHGAFGDLRDANIPHGAFGDLRDANVPRGAFGDLRDANVPRGAFGDLRDANVPRGAFGDVLATDVDPRATDGDLREAAVSRGAFFLHGVAAVLVAVGTSACAPSSRPEPAPPADAPHEGSSAAPAREAPPADERAADARADDVAAVPAASVATPADAGAGVDAARVAIADAGAGASTAGAEAHVKIVTIGMHVAGGPYDEPTKVPFKKAVEPRFSEIAQCWAAHVTKPPKQADFGVDLLIEAAGGKPKVSNPRSTLDKSETQGFTACVVGVFESVDFPKLVGRGRTGVSYSLRFTAR